MACGCSKAKKSATRQVSKSTVKTPYVKRANENTARRRVIKRPIR